jgi:hypothetical protein
VTGKLHRSPEGGPCTAASEVLITDPLITDYFLFALPLLMNFPLARKESPALTWVFAGEPLAEIRGLTAKPFEPDAGNAAEGSVRWSCVAKDDDHTVLPKEPSDLR